MWNPFEDNPWLWRGVPEESEEVADVEANGEVQPRRPDRIGERWQLFHSAGNTETGYTSWTTDRSIAVAAAEASSEVAGLSGRIRIFRVRTSGLDPDRVFAGREDEDEFLIERIVEDVLFSEESTDEDDE